MTDGISPFTSKRPPIHRKYLDTLDTCHVAEKPQPVCYGAKSTKTRFSRPGRIVHGSAAAVHGVYRVLSGLVWDGVSEMDEEMHNFCHQTGYYIWLFLGRIFMYIGSILLLPRHPF